MRNRYIDCSVQERAMWHFGEKWVIGQVNVSMMSGICCETFKGLSFKMAEIIHIIRSCIEGVGSCTQRKNALCAWHNLVSSVNEFLLHISECYINLASQLTLKYTYGQLNIQLKHIPFTLWHHTGSFSKDNIMCTFA